MPCFLGTFHAAGEQPVRSDRMKLNMEIQSELEHCFCEFVVLEAGETILTSWLSTVWSSIGVAAIH
jgi:hypothetical protein